VAVGKGGDVARAGVELTAVTHDDVQCALHVVLEVGGLAQVRAGQRLHVLRPPPSGLEGEPPDLAVADTQQVELTPLEGPDLVRGGERLLLGLGHVAAS